ncbi:MAG: hypothetical protein ABID45_00385, partial [Patescibacteria group bacterium]
MSSPESGELLLRKNAIGEPMDFPSEEENIKYLVSIAKPGELFSLTSKNGYQTDMYFCADLGEDANFKEFLFCADPNDAREIASKKISNKPEMRQAIKEIEQKKGSSIKFQVATPTLEFWTIEPYLKDDQINEVWEKIYTPG